MAQDYSGIDAAARNYPFTTDYQRAASELTREYADDRSKLRAIFSWIVHNINYDTEPLEIFRQTGKRGSTKFQVRSQEELDQQMRAWEISRIQTALKERKGVCMDYSFLLKHMCEAVGIEALYLSGFGRFSPQTIGKVHSKPNHAWNAVKLEDAWHLLDATWSTGMAVQQHLVQGYFLVTPDIFIHTHHPDSAQWQLLENPLSAVAFADLAFMQRGFLEHNGVDFQPRGAYISNESTTRFWITFSDEPAGRLMIMEGEKPILAEVKKGDNGYFITYKPERPVPRMVSISVLLETGRIEPLVTYKSQ